MGSISSKRALLEKNKKWVMARMGCLTAAANTVSPETQVRFSWVIFARLLKDRSSFQDFDSVYEKMLLLVVRLNLVIGIS